MKKILLCTDGSAYSSVSCQYAAWMAKLASASLTILYVTDIRQFDVPFIADFSGSLGIQPYQDLLGQMRQLEQKKALVIESTARKILAESGYTGEIGFLHRTGLLVDVVEEVEAESDLVIVGKRGASADVAIEHLGTNMERVIRASKKPVLVTSRSYREIQKILVAWDGSPSSQKAIEYLCRTTALRTCQIHVTTVISRNHHASPPARWEEIRRQLLHSYQRVESVVLEGHVDETIADYVKSAGIDLLLMGAYGHSRIRTLIIGSITTALIRECKIPILCFR